MIIKGCVLLLLILTLGFFFKWLYFGLQYTETPHYQEFKKQGKISWRHYPPLNIVKVKVQGPQQEALQKGFVAVAAYIFGENATHTKIAMTKPVLQMGQAQNWQVAFILPQKYALSDLPLPVKANLELLTLMEGDYLVQRFSGRIRESRLQSQMLQLMTFAQVHDCQVQGEPIFAFYNPPWTLPFMRRNEVWLKLEKACL